MTASRRTLLLAARARRHARGVGLVETMVGILIGMIVILVVYNILSVSENYRRTTVGASDAQINGLLTQLVAGRDAGNGGAGFTVSGDDLDNCKFNEAGQDIRNPAVTPWDALDAAVRPIPLLIKEGGNAWTSDSFISMFGGGSHVMWPVDLTVPFPAIAGALITVQSPNGFTVPTPTITTPYWGVIMSNESAGPNVGRCKMIKVVAATVADAAGKVGLTQDASTATSNAYTANGPARFLNLGPAGQATRILYEVDYKAPTYRGVLQTTDLLTTNALVTNPVTQNIVLMKVQYGVDTNADGFVDCWTAANNSNTCGDGKDYSVDGAAGVRHMPLADLNRILAVRIGVVVRSDEPDLRLLTNPGDQTLKDEAKGILQATRPQPYLFNCSADTNAACQSRVKVPMGNGGGAANCGNNVICDYWRYRTYETVVPLRNAIFSATLP